ncbi:aminoglycoside 3'-phosphotransferase [Luteococcus peritonei]
MEAVWVNEIGGTTWRIGRGEAADYLKVQPEHREFDLRGELARLDWVAGLLPTPRVVSYGGDGELEWLRTRSLGGENAVSPTNRARPEVVVPALGRALRRLHDSLPVRDCPFTWDVDDRLASLSGTERRPVPAVARGDLVVCHGDACSPNFLLGPDAECVGYVDLGRLGLADRHADLAPAVLSLGWNYGPGWMLPFLKAYGHPVDQERLAFYTWLWQAE